MDQTRQEPVPLSYGRKPRHARLLRFLQATCLFAVGAALVVSVVRQGLPLVYRLAGRWAASAEREQLYERCLTHTYAPDTLIFDESTDPKPDQDRHMRAGVATRLVRPSAGSGTRPPGYPDGFAAGHPCWSIPKRDLGKSSWNQLIRLDDDRWSPPAMGMRCERGLRPYRFYTQLGPNARRDWADEVFVHGRKRPDGEERLVVVGFDAGEFMFGGAYPFKVQVLEPPLWAKRLANTASPDASRFSFIVPPDQPLKLYAGKPDPADATHFTIGYETPVGAGTIDGYLQNDNAVRLTVRNGPAMNPSLAQSPGG